MASVRSDLTRWEILVFFACLGATVAAINAAASAWLSDQTRDGSLLTRPAHVIVISRDPNQLPPPAGNRSMVLLIGNSHTFGLPGLERGQPLRSDAFGTLIDELVRRVEPYAGAENAAYYRLSYPNFLPFEIVTTVSHLIYRGYHPKVVVMGWTWANISRQRDLRYDVYSVYRNADFVHWLAGQMADEKEAGTADIRTAIAGEERKARAELEEERMQSDADRLDAKGVDWLGQHVTLLGNSANLRVRLYKNVLDMFEDALVNSVKNYQYGVVESDLDFNVKCMRLALRMLKSDGAQVLIYYAPQRSDLRAFTENQQEEEVLGELSDFARQLGFSVVDATHVVPNEYWGWAGNFPDRAHFTEPGHRLLAQFLFEAGVKEHLWDGLRRPTTAADRESPPSQARTAP